MKRAYPLADWLAPWVPVTELPPLAACGISADSRRIQPGEVFCAVRGAGHDGLDFAAEAVSRGAVAVLAAPRPTRPASGVPVIWIEAFENHLGAIAARFYDAPSERLRVIGITGTNGKSSVAHFLAQAWPAAAGRPGALCGTLGSGPPDHLRPLAHTTPDAVTLQGELARLAAAGVDLVALEVSSHALTQGRVNGTHFAAAVFTNLSRDHLDYHEDLSTYGAAKARLFYEHAPALAVLNTADAFGAALAAELDGRLPVLRYALDAHAPAEVRGTVEAVSAAGLTLRLTTPWGEALISPPILGRFQAHNITAAAAVLGGLGLPFAPTVAALERLAPVPGRMQPVATGNGRPRVLVDYAHTPDALANALRTAREMTGGRLIVVFGCGGERDAGKRPLMGEVAVSLADRVILTDDNPRHEPPAAIVAAIAAGMTGAVYDVIHDRAAAIRAAIAAAGPGDLVLIAGKGHEHEQITGDRRRPFDDAAVARQALEEAA